MVILYQKGLENMAEYLRVRGMDVVPFGKAARADALIYSQGEGGLINSLPIESGPLFLLNVHNKTQEDVFNMLKNKLYSLLSL